MPRKLKTPDGLVETRQSAAKRCHTSVYRVDQWVREDKLKTTTEFGSRRILRRSVDDMVAKLKAMQD